MDKSKLLALIADDDLGLLKVKPKASGASSSVDRLVSSFGEINDFIRANERVPEPNQENVQEYRLYSRLQNLREDRERAAALSEFDEFNLLSGYKPIETMADIFADDDLGLLNSASDSIFVLKHVPKETTMPDYVGSRKPCVDFADFEPLLQQCQRDITAGKRKLWPFAKEQQIEAGLFFVLKGILLYVAEVGEREVVNGKQNARLRCIFENGTESDMLLRSLAAELYKNGRRVSVHDDDLLNGMHGVSDEDKESGFIYVLRSQSQRPDVASLANLYKIGFCRGAVEDRIKNALQEPTYLMAPVSIVTAFKCYNVNPLKVEQLLHRFFGSACLDVQVIGKDGITYTPREWFIAPLPIIEQAVHFLITEEIVQLQYDPEKQEIVPRNLPEGEKD
jgi:hypothetical protein